MCPLQTNSVRISGGAGGRPGHVGLGVVVGSPGVGVQGSGGWSRGGGV